MRPTERQITRLLRSRMAPAVMAVYSVFALIIARAVADVPHLPGASGFVAAWSGIKITTPALSWIMSLSATAVVTWLLWWVNRNYNLLRTSSVLYMGLFLVMMASSPLVTTSLCSGTVAAAVLLTSMGLMYSVYQHRYRGTRRIFLTFALLSASCTMQYALGPYLLVFAAGIVQMRCTGSRVTVAALLGIITPWWILWGLGIVGPEMLNSVTMQSVFEMMSRDDMAQTVATVILAMGSCLTFTIANLAKIYAYNARSRAFNGLLLLVTIFTILLAMVDFGNIPAYMPMLYCCTAYQATLFFRINAERRGYLPVLLMIGANVMLFVWSLT